MREELLRSIKQSYLISNGKVDILVRLILLQARSVAGTRWQTLPLKANPRKFDYAKPLKHWQKDWPSAYHQMLNKLKENWPGGRGIQEFVRILMLHERYPDAQMEQAIERALSYGCVHLDGVLYCLHEMAEEASEPSTAPLDLSKHPDLDAVGNQPVDLSLYERLLKLSW